MTIEAKSDDSSTGPNKIDATENNQEDSFITCEMGNENSGDLSEEVTNDVEEVSPINRVCRSSKRESHKAAVESDSDESKRHDFGCDTIAEGEVGEGSQTRARKRSKYMSYPYYTDRFLKFIAKDSKIPKKLRECVTQEDSEVSKACSGRKFNNESNGIIMSCHDLLSQLQMAAIDCHYPNKTKSFDSVKVFFSMVRKSLFRDESSIELSSMNTIQQMDVPDSSVANCKPCSFDFSAPRVLALYSPRYMALYSPTILGATKGGKTGKATDYSGISSPIVKSEAKRRNRKEETSADKPQREKRNSTIRPRLMSLNDVVMKSAEMAKLNNSESISRVIDLPIDPELRNNENISDALVSMNTDICTVVQAVDGSVVEDGKEVIPSEEKPGPKKRGRPKKSVMARQTSCGNDVQNLNQNVEDGKEVPPSEEKPVTKKRGRKKKSVMACQNSCGIDVQNLNHNVAETISQGKDAPKDKRGRKKRVTGQNAVKNLQNGTSECSFLNTDGTALVSLENEARPILMANETALVLIGNETESVLMGNEAELVLIENEAEPVLMGNKAEPLEIRSEGKPLSLDKKAELGLLGNEFEQLSLGKEATSDSLKIVAEPGLQGNHMPGEAKQGMIKKNSSVRGGMPPLSTIKQNLQTMTAMLAKTSDKVPAEMKTKLKEKIESLIVKVNTREGSSAS